LALTLTAFAGCGGGRDAAQRGDTTPRYSIVTKRVEPDWDAPLPPDVCFVGSRDYEVEITARSLRRPRLCERLFATYLPQEPRLRWPPPYLRDPDSAPSVVCVLADGADRVEIDYGPADSGRLDAESICDALIDQGWKRRPAWEGVDG
jgi:hypothetical protein